MDENHPHSHEDIVQLIYIHNGCGIMAAGDKKLLAVSGQWVWIPQHLVHQFKILKDSTLSIIHAYPLAVPDFGREMGLISTNSLIIQLMTVIATYSPQLAIQQHYLEVLRDQISQQHFQDTPYRCEQIIDKRLLPVMEALTVNPDIKLSLETFAVSCGASVRTLNRLFQSTFNYSFRGLRQQMVMEKAYQLSCLGVSQTEIALELGYNSLSAFSTAYNNFLRERD